MTDLERISIHSDANSLCSEPVKMYDYNDFHDDHPLNNNLDDLFDFSITNNNNKLTVSLSDLDKTGGAVTNYSDATGFTSELNLANDRSDSPILEGIDQELAKYAQLKDLEKAYHPTAAASVSCTAADPCISSSTTTNRTTIPNHAANFHLQRNPDGASNPDLNCKPTAAA